MWKFGIPTTSPAPSDATTSGLKSYKTSLCNAFARFGVCERDIHCTFAHGPAELRQRIRPPNFKTRLCRNMRDMGRCPYGAKCDFVHSASDVYTAAESSKQPTTRGTLPRPPAMPNMGASGVGFDNQQSSLNSGGLVYVMDQDSFNNLLNSRPALPPSPVSPPRDANRHHFSEMMNIGKAIPAPIGFERAHRDGLQLEKSTRHAWNM
ncbi:hypothetical protein GGI07_002577 [Coemansia sp. Benny D115]|nr:hypothetical protein GGI07_002577 [Coemansia sp. Benny D115]